jgi:preprotein translocase subunit SecG
MTMLFLILVILVSVVLGFIVLVQNPKGGGLAGNIAGFSSQFMGVKQTTDVLEKGTWIFGAAIGILCLVSSFFLTSSSGSSNRNMGSPGQQQQQQQQTPPAGNTNPGTNPAPSQPNNP